MRNGQSRRDMLLGGGAVVAAGGVQIARAQPGPPFATAEARQLLARSGAGEAAGRHRGPPLKAPSAGTDQRRFEPSCAWEPTCLATSCAQRSKALTPPPWRWHLKRPAPEACA